MYRFYESLTITLAAPTYPQRCVYLLRKRSEIDRTTRKLACVR